MANQLVLYKCECGSYTIIINGIEYSMPEEEFHKRFGYEKAEHVVFQCNYCMNNWGIDLCACSSGEKVDECKGNTPVCGTPMQILVEPYTEFT